MSWAKTRFFVKQALYDAGATSNLVEGVRQSIIAQEYDVKKTMLDIILNIKSTFYEVVKRGALLDVTKSSLNSAEKHHEQAKALYSEGLSARFDMIKASVQVSNAQLDVIKAENAVLLAKANLATAMGLPVMINFEVTTEGSTAQTAMRLHMHIVVDLKSEVSGQRSTRLRLTSSRQKVGFIPV